MTIKRILFSIAPVVVVCIAVGIGFWRYEPMIHARIANYKEQNVRKAEYSAMHEGVDKIAALPNVVVNGDEWFCNRLIISHSGGGICGYCYTNSKEAWHHSYERGNRVFDADCLFTSDSIMVLRHSWLDNLEQDELLMSDSRIWIDRNGQVRCDMKENNRMDYKTCMGKKIHKYFTPQSGEDMIRFMQSHPDLYVATDVKEYEIERGYHYIVDKALAMDAAEVLDRIVVSLYDYKDFATVKTIYPFKNYSIRQYVNVPHNYLELAQFCQANDIKVIQVSLCYVNDEGVKALVKKGFKVYVAVVDHPVEFDRYREMGIHGCVSNWLYQDKLQ